MTTASSRTRRIAWLTVGIAMFAAIAVLGIRSYRVRHSRRVIRIATGMRGGTFLPLGQVLARTFTQGVPNVDARALESPGSPASVAMLEHGQVEMALVSNNTPGGDSVRLITPLYEETLQIVVRRAAAIHTPLDLRRHAVAIGAAGSGTEAIAWQVLGHFGIARTEVDARNLSFVAAADALERGEIDASFIVAGMRTPIVDRLLRRDDMELLSLGDTSRPGSAVEGIRIDAPFLIVSVIPEHAYGAQPAEPIGTISVKALLVARADLDDDLVREITSSLFAAKVRLAERERLLSRLSERFDPADSPFPIHPGADRYYRRDEPTFIQKYNDQIGLALTLGALVWSAFTALRAWRQRSRKGRIEDYYQDTRTAAAEVREGATVDQVRAAQRRLEEIRSRAFEELMGERLEANESFTILQDYLSAELARVRRVLERSGAPVDAALPVDREAV
jgi:TRAP transporter TAXI family solute receptor